MDLSPWIITTSTPTTCLRRPPRVISGSEVTWGYAPLYLETLVEGFAPIHLTEMNAVALLNRTDTKFAMPVGQLRQALVALQPYYRILCLDGQRMHHYRTLYFDTPDFALYHLHVNKRANLYKVRCREYTDSHESFFEVKHKTNKDRTIKKRISTTQPIVELTAEAVDWLRGIYPYDSQALEPKIWNTFTRITLVSKACCERVTLDVDLAFYTADQVVHMNNLAIAEVKMGANGQASPFMAQMRAQHIHSHGFSKYCTGTSLLYDQVKKNTMKPKLLRLEKMMKGYTNND